ALFITQGRALVVASSERNLRQPPVTGRVARRRLQRLFKMNSRILNLAERQFIDTQILQGRNKFGIKRQDLVELLVRFLSTARGGESDPHQVASFEIVRRAIQNLLQDRKGPVKLPLLHEGDGGLIVRVLRANSARACQQGTKHPHY